MEGEIWIIDSCDDFAIFGQDCRFCVLRDEEHGGKIKLFEFFVIEDGLFVLVEKICKTIRFCVKHFFSLFVSIGVDEFGEGIHDVLANLNGLWFEVIVVVLYE